MGCTGSKSLAMQARLEGWEDGPIKTTKSFVRSLSMPLGKPSSGSSFSSVSGDGGGEHRNYSGNLQRHSGGLENHSGGLENHSGSLHTVQLMSTTYGALRISDDEEEQRKTQDRRHRAPPPPGSPPPAASLAKIPEAEVIDLGKLMRELDEEAAAPRRRRRRQQQQPRSLLAAEWRRQRRQDQARAMVLGRSISSVASARELDAKIRAIVLALPNSRKKLRALESLQSIFFCDDDDGDDGHGDDDLGDCSDSGSERSSSLQSRSMKGLFYGATLEESWSPSSCPMSPAPRLPSLSPLHENQSQLPSGSCAASPLPAAVSTSTSSAGPPSSSEEEDPLFFEPASVESFQQGAESANPTPAAPAAQETKHIFEESRASTAATMRAKRMQSSKVCSVDEEEERRRRLPPGGGNRVVLYVTSLRGVRKTFEDCNLVRAIVRGFGVAIDERDVSMHAEFRTELRALMEAWCGVGSSMVVPRLFVKGDYVGGAEDVLALNEEGAIGGLLEGIPRTNGGDEVCGGCGDIRFVPCGNCCGSTKLVQVDGSDFMRCPSCNENGLVRCPICL